MKSQCTSDNSTTHFPIASNAKTNMSDSGAFQDVESNSCGRLSHVSSQPVMIPSSRSMFSRDRRLPLDTCNQSGLQENVVENQFSTADSPRYHPQRSQSDNVQRNREAVPGAGRTKTTHTSEDRQNQGRHNSNADLCYKAVEFEFYNTGGITAELHGRTAKTANYRNCNPTNSLIHNCFWCGKCDSQLKSTWSDFPSDAMLWIKEVEMVDSLDELKSSRSVCGKGFFKLGDAGREDCFCFEQDHPASPVQEDQLRGAESTRRGPVSTRKTDRLHDVRLFSSDWRS